MALVQLDFLEETEISALKAEFKEVKASCDRVRKKQFADIGALRKEILELRETVDILVRNLCQNKPDT